MCQVGEVSVFLKSYVYIFLSFKRVLSFSPFRKQPSALFSTAQLSPASSARVFEENWVPNMSAAWNVERTSPKNRTILKRFIGFSWKFLHGKSLWNLEDTFFFSNLPLTVSGTSEYLRKKTRTYWSCCRILSVDSCHCKRSPSHGYG